MPASRLHPFLRLLLCAIIVAVVTTVIGVAGAGVVIARNPTLGLVNPTPTQLTQKLVHDYGLWLTVFAYPPALFIIWLFRTNVDHRSWASLGFNRKGAAANFALGALTGILTLSVLFTLMWLSGAIQFGGLSQDVLTRGWPYAIIALCGYALAFLLVGFMEETAFRGYGLHNGKDWFGWTGAVWLQAILFALVHMGNSQGSSDPNALKAAIGALPSLTLIAVFFALAYRKTGSLWFPIGFHAAWNFFLGCVFSQPVSAIGTFRLFDVQETGKNFLSGGDFGAEGSFFLIPIIVGMIYLLWRSPDHPQALADFDEPEAIATVAPVYQPAYATASASPVASATEDEEAPRSNRYNARFGSAEGFDSGMLRELKQMQESREEAERQRMEAERAMRQAEEARQEALRHAQIAAQNAKLQKEAEAPSTTPEPQTSAPEVEEPIAAVSSAATDPITPVVPKSPVEAPKEVQASPPVTPPAPVVNPVPVVPSSPEKKPSPIAPPAPVPQPVPASSASVSPQTPVPSSPPSEAPPKKARPRW